MHFSIEGFRWPIAVKGTLRGEKVVFSGSWLPDRPSPTVDNVSTPVFDRPLVIVIPSHILKSV
jgi:hypothetical protein